MPLRSRLNCGVLTVAALLLFNAPLAPALTAQAPEWPVQRLHAPSSSLPRLPQADQAIAIKLLRPELGPLFQGDATSMLDQQIRSFRAERITLGGIPAFALAPSGGDLCGNNGNCSFWILDRLHHRILLRTEAVQAFAVETTKRHVMPNLITSTRNSAARSEITRWHYATGYYERERCATVDYADQNGAPLKAPRVTPHPCSPEGN